MAKSQELENFSHMVEKIIFDDNELERLKIAIKNFIEGKISAKDLKHLLLQCRGRMVEEMTDFGFFFAKKTATLTQTAKNTQQPSFSSKVESQLKKEIEEKNELLEIVAERINRLLSSKDNNKNLGLGLIEDQDQEPISIEEVKEEVDRCLTQIGAEQWIKMSYYEDYQFFIKLYPKLEELYDERFYESEKNPTEGKEIMANRMVRLGFPEDIEHVLINYISIRNNFNHSMVDISPSNLELAREVFVKVFVDLIINALDSKLLLENREKFYSSLTDFFSRRLTGNSVFRREILDRLKTVFKSSSLYPYG